MIRPDASTGIEGAYPAMRRLQRHILLLAVFGIVFTGLSVTIGGILPLYEQMKEEMRATFLHTLRHKRLLVEQHLARSGDVAMQISSRTKAREKLEAFNRGKVSRADLQTFLAPIMEEALQKTRAVVGITRLDARGGLAARVGKTIPGNLLGLWKRVDSTPVFSDPVRLDPQRTHHLLVGAPILDRNGERQGTDLVLIELSELQQVILNRMNLSGNGHFHLIWRRDGGFGALPEEERFPHPFDEIPQPVISGEEGFLEMGESHVFAYTPIKGAAWFLLLAQDRKALYHGILSRLVFIGFILLLLVGLGVAVTLWWLRSLSGRVLVRADQLEKEVSARQRAHRSLAESEGRFRDLVETTSDWIWAIDARGRYTYSSPKVEELLGYAPEAVIGKTPFDFMPPEEAERVKGLFEEITAKRQPFEGLENTIVSKDGRRVILESSGVPIFDDTAGFVGYRGMDRDVTSRNESAETLRKLARIVAISSDHLSIVDRHYVYQTVNDAYLTAHGKQRREIEGHSVESLLEKEVFQRIKPQLDRCLAGEHIRYQAWFHFPGSGRCWMDVQYHPFHEPDGTIGGIVVASRDLTKLKETEEALIQSKNQAEAANRAKSEFLTIMSHEIRTPLNAILGMAEIVRESDLDPERAHYMAILNRSGENLLNLIEDILDLARIESGQLALERCDIDLRALTREAMEVQHLNAAHKGLTLHCHVDPGVPERIPGDLKRIRQVLLNILGNAVKFTDRGGITLRVSVADTANLLFSIKDTGIGIPADKQALIFEPFSQADASITRRHGGVGLGLSLCKRLVDAMGGRIWVEEHEDRGSLFRFTIPLPAQLVTAEHHPIPVDRAVDRQPMAAGATASRAILLVEDVEENALVVETFLRHTPHRLDMVDDGDLAVEKVQNGGRYDLVLMDIQMPRMDGLEATRLIRTWEKRQNRPRTPIVALTAHAMAGDAEKSLDAGCDGHLTKPISKKKLLMEIDRYTA